MIRVGSKIKVVDGDYGITIIGSVWYVIHREDGYVWLSKDRKAKQGDTRVYDIIEEHVVPIDSKIAFAPKNKPMRG